MLSLKKKAPSEGKEQRNFLKLSLVREFQCRLCQPSPLAQQGVKDLRLSFLLNSSCNSGARTMPASNKSKPRVFLGKALACILPKAVTC